MDELLDIFKKTVRQIHGDSLAETEVERLAKEWVLSSSNYENLTNSICFSYYSKTIPIEKIKNFESNIKNFAIDLICKDRSKEILNSVEFMPEVLIVLGSGIVDTILTNAAGSGLWALVVDWIKYVRLTIANKKLKKITGGKVVKELDMEFYLIFKIKNGGTIGCLIHEDINEIELNDKTIKSLLESQPKVLEKDINIVHSKKRYRYCHQTKNWIEMH